MAIHNKTLSVREASCEVSTASHNYDSFYSNPKHTIFWISWTFGETRSSAFWAPGISLPMKTRLNQISRQFHGSLGAGRGGLLGFRPDTAADATEAWPAKREVLYGGCWSPCAWCNYTLDHGFPTTTLYTTSQSSP